MKKLLILFCCLPFFTSIFPQNINGRISSSFYTFERFDTIDVSNTYLRSFQQLSLNINQAFISLRTYINFENDLSKNIKDDPRVRFYNLYLEAKDIADIFTLKIGRQPLFNSVAGGLFDGASMDIRYSILKLSGYYGGNVPAFQKFDITDDFENDYIYGGRLTISPVENLQADLSYTNKNFRVQEYWASRLDEDLNPIQVLIRNNSNQYEFASGEIFYEMEKIFSLQTRYDYDLNLETTSKFEIFGEYNQLSKIKFNAYYNYREPRIRYNSIFSVFDYGNTQEFEVGSDLIINDDLTLIGKYGYVEYKDENSSRITAGINSSYGSLIFRKNLGYAGEMDAVSFYAAHSFLEGEWTPSIGISFTSYKPSPESEENRLATVLAGLNYRPWRSLSFDLQGQYLNNRIYNDDYRLFFRANYWFNTNLNLF